MEIDLTLLHSGSVEEIPIHEVVTFSPSYYENTEIKMLDDVEALGKIKRLTEEIDHITLSVHGTMVLEDSISLEKVEYPFSIEIDQDLEENTKKDENTLDFSEFLWENIVLEIPLKYTKVEDLSQFRGDGWRLMSEDEPRFSSNPFQDLLKDRKEE